MEGKNEEKIKRVYTLKEIEKGIMLDHFKNNRLIHSRKVLTPKQYEEEK